MPRSEPAITLDASLPEPPSVRIFEQIRALIERGDVALGDPLPTVRQLAGDSASRRRRDVLDFADAAPLRAARDRSRSDETIARGPCLIR